MANINRQRENYRKRLKRRRKEERRLRDRCATTAVAEKKKITSELSTQKGSDYGQTTEGGAAGASRG